MKTWILRGVVAIALTPILGACGGSAPNQTADGQVCQQGVITSTSTSGYSCWDDYDPSVKKRIDKATLRKNCEALQREFNAADSNNERMMNRTGHNNADLMGYINDQKSVAGCYM